ncbi:hypothetical protein HY947_06695 [Candidatus Gottesmanbacteria bacterium]|nr:hypothetical protein [Candidatus Gottesmanbacteria bacterium]
MNGASTILPAAFFGLKILTLIGLSLYAIFAFVVFRQEQLMASVLDEAFEPMLKIIVVVHFLFSLGLFFLATVIL